VEILVVETVVTVIQVMLAVAAVLAAIQEMVVMEEPLKQTAPQVRAVVEAVVVAHS
jgi:hypothetical protein